MAILHFPHVTGSRFMEPIFLTKHCYQTLNFANKTSEMSQIGLELLVKNLFLAAILNFPIEKENRFFEVVSFINHYY